MYNAIALHRRQFSLWICSSHLVTLSSSSLLSKIHCYQAPILPEELVLIVAVMVVMVVKMAKLLELVSGIGNGGKNGVNAGIGGCGGGIGCWGGEEDSVDLSSGGGDSCGGDDDGENGCHYW